MLTSDNKKKKKKKKKKKMDPQFTPFNRIILI